MPLDGFRSDFEIINSIPYFSVVSNTFGAKKVLKMILFLEKNNMSLFQLSSVKKCQLSMGFDTKNESIF